MAETPPSLWRWLGERERLEPGPLLRTRPELRLPDSKLQGEDDCPSMSRTQAAMRNIFDQYSQPENRITHALMSALNEDRALLKSFLMDLIKFKPPVDARHLTVLEQRYPGEDEPSEEELERRGIPDGWIVAEEHAWCVFIETKVLIKLRGAQIESHRRTAARRGFQSVTAVSIAPLRSGPTSDDTVQLEWRTVYAWLSRRRKESAWAARTAAYLEIAEAKLIDSGQFVEGTLTMFTGFPFGSDHPYTYLEAKRVLQLALGDLRARRDLQADLDMNPKIGGRPAITGRQSDAVWDFLSLSGASDAGNFTRYPHLTLGVTAKGVEAMVTVPNAINTVMRQNLKQLGETGFQELNEKIVENTQPLLKKAPGAAPWFRGVQRRYPSQRATPFLDARIEFDLRTAAPAAKGPKGQPRWLSAAYGSFSNKEGTNYQIQMGVVFAYERCPEIRGTNALDLIAQSWLSCKPLVDLAR